MESIRGKASCVINKFVQKYLCHTVDFILIMKLDCKIPNALLVCVLIVYLYIVYLDRWTKVT